jgi:hypothetical protein
VGCVVYGRGRYWRVREGWQLVGGQTVVRGQRLSFVSGGCRLWAVYVVRERWVVVHGP